MIYKYCGHSGIQLPLLSLGLWHNFGSVDDYGTARAMLLRAFEAGICHFDLACLNYDGVITNRGNGTYSHPRGLYRYYVAYDPDSHIALIRNAP